jgi:hypothetical protein
MLLYNYGNLTKNSRKRRIEKCSESLFRDRLKLTNIEYLSWEKFTTEYMKLALPKNKLQEISWKQTRPKWIQKINEIFSITHKETLIIVEHGKGIKIYLGREGVIKGQLKTMKKVMTITGRHYQYLEDLKTNFPSFSRQTTNLQHILDDYMHSILGRVETDRSLAKDTKAQLSENIKNNIQKWLPAPNPFGDYEEED